MAGAATLAELRAEEPKPLIDKQNGGFKLEPWDWNFYAEQVRKAKYDLNEDQAKPHFEMCEVWAWGGDELLR